jgi:hypothetical protein
MVYSLEGYGHYPSSELSIMTASIQTKPTSLPVQGAIARVLRSEGLALFGMSVLLYSRSGASWSQFAWLFLLPDLSFAGYLLGPRAGAIAYNTLHSELGPACLAVASLLGIAPSAALPIALIWAAHVGLDRALGYGLKYADAFTNTHLGRLGQARRALPQREA